MARDRAAVRDAVPGLITLVLLQGSLILVDPREEPTGWILVWSFSALVSRAVAGVGPAQEPAPRRRISA